MSVLVAHVVQFLQDCVEGSGDVMLSATLFSVNDLVVVQWWWISMEENNDLNRLGSSTLTPIGYWDMIIGPFVRPYSSAVGLWDLGKIDELQYNFFTLIFWLSLNSAVCITWSISFEQPYNVWLYITLGKLRYELMHYMYMSWFFAWHAMFSIYNRNVFFSLQCQQTVGWSTYPPSDHLILVLRH